MKGNSLTPLLGTRPWVEAPRELVGPCSSSDCAQVHRPEHGLLAGHAASSPSTQPAEPLETTRGRRLRSGRGGDGGWRDHRPSHACLTRRTASRSSGGQPPLADRTVARFHGRAGRLVHAGLERGLAVRAELDRPDRPGAGRLLDRASDLSLLSAQHPRDSVIA